MAEKWTRGGQQPKGVPATVVAVRPFELHGTPYYVVMFRYDGDPPDGHREARVSQDMTYAGIGPGDRVLVSSLLGVVDRIVPAHV
jgi:hypothetical protein